MTIKKEYKAQYIFLYHYDIISPKTALYIKKFYIKLIKNKFFSFSNLYQICFEKISAN